MEDPIEYRRTFMMPRNEEMFKDIVIIVPKGYTIESVDGIHYKFVLKKTNQDDQEKRDISH